MVRLLLLFPILFAAAVAFVALFPGPVRPIGPAAPVAADARVEVPQAAAGREVRVVYPPSAGIAAVAPDSAPVVAQTTNPVAVAAPAPVAIPAVAAVPQQAATGLQPDVDAILKATAKVDLNTASVEELDQLPGGGRIGRAIASRRPYGSVEDLITKHVLRKSVYDRIKDQVAAQ